MTTRLLCAIDAAYPSRPAVEAAVEMALLLDVPLAFLAVNPVCEEGASKTRVWDERIAAAVDAHLSCVLADASTLARHAGLVEFECVVASGLDIAAAIVDYARENGFDHIVLGSSRPPARSGVAHGSLAADVKRAAACPVTIVR